MKQTMYTPVVEELKIILSLDPKIETALLASINIAVESAKKNLNANLYKAIDNEFNGNGWPTTIEKYFEYLDAYVQMVPNESNDSEYPSAWKSDNTKNGYNQKVYDLLCQLYWLINQKLPETGLTMQSFGKFATWLVDFANAWGLFLDSEASLTPESLQSFKNDSMYNFPLYADGEKNWSTFNQFFYRNFNEADSKTGISPLRPIASPNDNTTIASPADCTYKQFYPINKAGDVLDIVTGEKIDISLKQTHAIGNVNELLQNSKYADSFYGGTFVHYFLSPFDYHRFHTPVSGEILEIAPVEGKVYLNVELTDTFQFDAPDSSDNGYEFTQARGMVVMDAGEKVGKIAILPIGMCVVSGVDMYTELKGQRVVKGQEFGKFKFGGSDIIVLFEKKPEDLYMFTKDPSHNPIHFQYGQTSVYIK